MAHHVAGLITAAKGTKNKAQRVVAEERAVQTILKLWEHRMALPGQAYPLAQFKDILELLSKLTPEANPWYRQARGERQQLALNLFNELTHLTDLLLALEAKPAHFSSKRSTKVFGGFLPPKEDDMYQVLIKFIGRQADASEAKRLKNSISKGDNDTPIVRQLKRTIARTKADLTSLLRVLGSKVADSDDENDEGLVYEY